MASLDDIVTVGNSFNKNISQLIVALQQFQTLYQGVIDVAHGGTGRTSLTANNVLLGNGTSPINFVAPGTSGNVLTSNGTTWASTALPVTPANVSSITFGTTGLTPSTATTGAVSVAGRLAVGSGGTDKTSFTAYSVVCGGTTTTGALQNVASVGTSGQVLKSNGAAALPSFQTLQIYRDFEKTVSTSSEYTGIPSWVRRITLMFNGVSTNGTTDLQVQLGNATTVYANTTYIASCSSLINASTVSTSNSTTGLNVRYTAIGDAVYGIMTICNLTGNTWCENFAGRRANLTCMAGGGQAVLDGTLDRIRLTTSNTFDAGTINIFYE